MKIIRGAKANYHYNNYTRALERYGIRWIDDCYKSASIYKENAERLIREDYARIERDTRNLTAKAYTVCGHNCNHFSAAFSVVDMKQNKRIAIIYYTHANTYCIPFDGFDQYADEIAKCVRG